LPGLLVSEPAVDPTALIAPGAEVHGRVTIGPRVFILFGAVLRAEFDLIDVGAETNVQDNAVLHCDQGYPCIVGRRVTIGHSAVVHGAFVRDHALVGIGATMLNGSTLGEGSWLAAGSVLGEGKEIPPRTLAVGTPARPVRDLDDADLASAAEGVDHYLTLLDSYRTRFSM
jgi:carbonic anhydrase/acetyltransferase-like protein (isoleucine patch superfamily)